MQLTITSDIQIYDTPYSDIDDSEEALILLLELLLVKYLNCQYAFFCSSPIL